MKLRLRQDRAYSLIIFHKSNPIADNENMACKLKASGMQGRMVKSAPEP